MRSWALLVCCAALAGCGVDPATLPARRSAIPVVVYERVEPDQFARQMALLERTGYDTITLETFVRFVRGERVALPRRPILLTFDGGRRDSWASSDPILREHGFNAVVFIDAGRVDTGDPRYLRWRELNAHERDGRWETQLQSGTGNYLMRYGPKPGEVGPFYAYRGNEEVLGGWRERVFGDISKAERVLAYRMPGYTPLAFSPPYGNYGQAGTNDPQIPRLLLRRLQSSFPIVFTQDRPPLARRGIGTEAPLGRLNAGGPEGAQALRNLLAGSPAEAKPAGREHGEQHRPTSPGAGAQHDLGARDDRGSRRPGQRRRGPHGEAAVQARQAASRTVEPEPEDASRPGRHGHLRTGNPVAAAVKSQHASARHGACAPDP